MRFLSVRGSYLYFSQPLFRFLPLLYILLLWLQKEQLKMSELRYDGQVVVVTEAGCGLGRSYALFLYLVLL